MQHTLRQALRATCLAPIQLTILLKNRYRNRVDTEPSVLDVGAPLTQPRASKLAPTFNTWWSQAGSNRRPSACKADALPAELWPPMRPFRLRLDIFCRILVGLGGLEPPTSPLSGVRSNHLSYRPGVAKRPCSSDTSLLPVTAHFAEQQTYGRFIPTA
jgi:hypothetical protein